MRQWCDDAGLKQCATFGLGKACARRLKEAGVMEQELASVLGYANATTPHSIIGMGDRTALADAAVSSLITPSNRRQAPPNQAGNTAVIVA